MIKDFIKECLNQAKEAYFNEDHHYYAGQAGKDADWDNMLKNMDRDFYNEWIDPVIYEKDRDLWYACDKFMLYMLTKDVIEESK